MKILSTSDIHSHIPWFDWLRKNAHSHDLIIIAGDLANVHLPFLPQIEKLTAWIAEWPEDGATLVISSGNHDHNDVEPEYFNEAALLTPEERLRLLPILKRDNWIGNAAQGKKNVITPGQIQEVRIQEETLLVSATEYPHFKDNTNRFCQAQWAKAHSLAMKKEIPLLVAHHCPPSLWTDPRREQRQRLRNMGMLLDTPEDDEGNWTLEAIKKYSPKYLFCGHHHHGPYVRGATIYIENTLCLNAGQLHPNQGDGLAPNYLTLNTQTEEILWNFFPSNT